MTGGSIMTTTTHHSIEINQRINGDFLSWYIFEIKFPIDLDLSDCKKTSIFYETWEKDRNIPSDYIKENAYIAEMGNYVRFCEMMLAKKKNVSYFLLTFKVKRSQAQNTISHLKEILSEEDVHFNLF